MRSWTPFYSRQIPDLPSPLHEPERLDVDAVVVAHHDDDPAADAHRPRGEVTDSDVVLPIDQLLRPHDLGAESLGDVFVQRESRLRRLVLVIALLPFRI